MASCCKSRPTYKGEKPVGERFYHHHKKSGGNPQVGKKNKRFTIQPAWVRNLTSAPQAKLICMKLPQEADQSFYPLIGLSFHIYQKNFQCLAPQGKEFLVPRFLHLQLGALLQGKTNRAFLHDASHGC